MIKHFCDYCGEEIGRNYVAERFTESSVLRGKPLRVEITVAVNEVWGNGAVCWPCLSDWLRPHLAEAK